MKQEVTISANCVVISENNEAILEDLLADLFVEFVNTRHGKQVVEKCNMKITREDVDRLIDEIFESSKDNDEDENKDV